MADKQLGKKHGSDSKPKHQDGNFGQQEARQASEKEDELRHMGDKTRQGSRHADNDR